MSLSIYGSSNVGAITGDAYMDQIKALIERLYGYAVVPLVSVAGTGDTATAEMPSGETATPLVETTKFSLLWPGANTGAVTLEIASGGAVPVLSAAGAALVAGQLEAGQLVVLEYRGTDFYVISDLSGGGGGGATRYFQKFTVSGTWTKPAGLPDDTPIRVLGWGAGGGGAVNGNLRFGGGGGRYGERVFRAGDVPASVAVAVGAGGAPGGTSGGAGSASSFGTLLSIKGGVGGYGSNTYGVGGAGGAVSAALADPHWDGGRGGSDYDGSTYNNHPGYPAIFGGGGGAGGSTGGIAGGSSAYGGKGGDIYSPGTAPGGGGGGQAAGARGEIWVMI